MLRYKFEVGRSYFATPADQDRPKRILTCVGRTADRVVFGRMAGTMRPDIEIVSSREFSRVDLDDVGPCLVSSACVADVEMAARVAEAMGA